MQKLFILAALSLFLFSCRQQVRVTDTPDLSGTRGPEKGSLLIVGGAMSDTLIIDRFIELAGGPEQPLLVIPTASGA